MHGMIVALGIGLAVLIAFVTFSLFATPPHTKHMRHRPPALTASREYTIRPRQAYDDNGPAGNPAEASPGKATAADEDYDDKRQKQVQVAAQVLNTRKAPKRSRKITTPPAEEEDGEGKPERQQENDAGHAEESEPKRQKKFDAGHAGEAKGSVLEPTDTLPEHPVVCIVNSQAVIEITYPQDGLCDAVIFNKIFYHSGQLSVGKTENHTYKEFLTAAGRSRLTAYMVATDRHFNLYEYVPAAPSLDALRKQHHVRGFGYLGIRVQSSQGEMLRQHTRLLRNQVEDLNSMLKEMEVPDSALFLGLTSEEHLFDDDIATAAFKAVINTVQVHLLIIENHQLKADDCLSSPITTWGNAKGIAFDEAQATASWMTETGMRPPSTHTAVAFSSWIPAMQFLRTSDTTVKFKNGTTRRCFVFSLSPYDKLMCGQPRRYHNVSDMYFAKEESMAGVYVYEDVEILQNKVYKVRRAMNTTTKNIGWAFFGLEYEGEDAGQCGHRYDRITAVKKALRAVRALRTVR
ncbi:uncharacterized protein LOC144132504 [Amblyomma americanum]